MCRIIIGLFCVLLLPIDSMSQDAKDAKQEKAKKKRASFTIGKDTTHVDGPIDKDGYIDYEAALNERLREGVTPENNAHVLLLQAFGPHPEGANLPADFYKWMKVQPPPEQGEYFVSHYKYVHQLKLKDEALEAALKQFDQAVTRPWSAKEFPDLAAWIKKNDKPLAVAIEATKRTHYYYPLVASRKEGKSEGLLTALIPGAQTCRALASALTARAMLRVHEKKYDEAWRDLLAVHRLGRLAARGGTLIEGLVGVALASIASNADLAFLDGAKLDAKKIKQCLADLQALPPMPRMADKMNLAERFWFLEFVMIVDRDGVGQLNMIGGGKEYANALTKVLTKITFSTVHWDSGMRASNKFYDRMFAAMSLKERSVRKSAMERIEKDIRELKASLSDPDAITARILTANSIADAKGRYLGDIMICLFMPAVAKVQNAGDRIEQTQRNLHLAFALAAYKADEGRYPMKLDALAPKYLAAVPNDMFNDKALIYRPKDNGYVLYSVGINGKDDGGRGYYDDPAGDDLVVRMPHGK